jgi:hypothetical protein
LTESAPSRAALVARRWASLATAACVATASVALILTTWPAVLRELLQRDGLTVLSALFVLVAFLVKGAWGRPFAYLGLKHFFVYPPLWVAGVMGAAAFIFAVGAWRPLGLLMELPEDHAPLLRALAGVAFVGIMVVGSLIHALVLVAAWAKSRRALKRLQARATNEREEGAKALSESWDKLQSWLERDAAVTNAGDDVFGHHEIAQRIARRLNLPREEAGTQQPKDTAQRGGISQLPSQAVVGALGSGKTTVRHLVEQELASDLRMVPVDLWPYHTPEAAVEGVLRSLIDAVAEEANVLAVRGLPGGYLRAMGAAGTLPSVLANLVDPAPNPYDTLASLDNLATTIGRRFVVWVEDLERFSAASKSDDSTPDALRMAPIWSLLFGLSQRRSITVITATVQLQARFDLEKVARFIEELPLIAPSTGVPIIRAVRQRCLTHFAAPSRLASEWDKFDAVLDDDMRGTLANKAFSLPRAVVTLARTPRTLKQGLRRVWEAWERLAGEIDFDDLLLMCLLREAEPDAFALIRDNWSAVAGAGYADDVRKKAKQNFNELRLGKAGFEGNVHESVKKILAVVFEEGKAEDTIQGLRHKRYWKRFIGEPEIPADDSDQAVLRILNGPDDLAILELLEGSNHDLVERFARELSAERLLRLLLLLVPRRVHESPLTWGAAHDPPGLIPLWRMIGDRRRSDRPQPVELADHLERAFELGITNLALVHALEYYFCETGTHGPLYLTDLDGALAERARQTLWRLLLEHYAGQPGKLVHALRGSLPRVLPFVVWGSLRHPDGRRIEEPFQGWGQLADTILDASRQQPQAMLLHLAALVADGRPTLRGKYEYTFNVERARLLFGDERPVLELFRNPPAAVFEADAAVRALRHVAVQYFDGQVAPAVP